MTRVDLYVDGTLLASDTTAPYGFGWDTTRALNGGHTLRAVAYDAAGNAGASANVTVNVSNAPDTTAPTVTISSLGVRASKLSVSVSASDNLAVTRVELYVDGALQATDTSSPWTFSVNTKPFASGSHTVQAKAYDAAGNSGLSAPQTFVK